MDWDTVYLCQGCTLGDHLHSININELIFHPNISLRYFKGDLQIASVHGYGTNVYVYLQRLSHMAQENIPVYNTRSSSRLKNVATQVPDWTDDKGF